MSCNGNVYNIGMGCCEPVLGPVENYYTKPTIDRKLEEITSAITSGCCITPEEVDEKIEEAISGITVSGVTEEQLNEAIASAKTEIEAEIPSLDGYATEQWVEDKHYITGVDLSDYALKSEIPTVPTSNTAFTNDAGYLTEHQSLSGYATTAFVSAFTYDKATIDEKVAGGGSFDPSQYYNKTATDALLDEKLDVTAYTPTDLSNYYTKQEVDSEIISAITDVEAEIPTVPTSNTAFTNDAGYLTEHQSLTAYSTTQEVNTMINQSVSGKQDTLIAGENITISGNVISATSGGGGTDAPISAGTGTDSVKENSVNNVASGEYSHAEGRATSASGNSSHAEGNGTSAKGNYAHAEGHQTSASGSSSHAEGELTNANGSNSHAEGSNTKANGSNSHAEGKYSQANGGNSHAEGSNAKANGSNSHAEGNSTVANGSNSHAEGDNTVANNESEHASGKYNVSNTGESASAQTLFSVGNGGWDETAQDVVRHNAFEVRQNGDIYITNDGLDVKLQDQLGGGGTSCTVDEKEIVENYNEIKYGNYQSKVYYAYSGTPTDNQYSYSFNIYDGLNNTYVNGSVNFGTGGHTGSTSGWDTYYSVTWDNTKKRFLFATNTGYNIHSMNASNHMIYLQVPIGTVSGTPCEAASTLTDAINEVSSKAQSAIIEANLIGEGRKISQYISKNNGVSFSNGIKLKDLKITDAKLETDINVGLGTSGWTNIDVSETCNLNDISITNFKAIYSSGIQYYYQKRITVGYEFRYTGGISYGDFLADFTDDTTLSVVLPTTDWSAVYDSATSALTVTAPEGNVEYHGNVGIFTITSLGSNYCKFGNGITLQQYVENTEPIRQYVQENRTAINSKASVWCGDEAAWGQISGGTLDSNTIYLVY